MHSPLRTVLLHAYATVAVVVTVALAACAAPTTIDAHGVPSWVDRGLYPFTPQAFATEGGTMRYVDEGPRNASEVFVFANHEVAT